MHTTTLSSLRRLALVLTAVASLLAPARAEAAEVLLVCDTTSDTEIATALRADGHTVTVVQNDFAGGNAALRADLSIYDAVYWSANGAGYGDVHGNAAVFTNLSTYVTNGGRVMVTGYDSIASPTDPMLITFLGGTSANDGASPGVIVSIDNAMTTGVLDIRGATPTGGWGDQDTMTGLTAGTIVICPSGTGAAWTLRTLGSGLIAYVSNGAYIGSSTPSWTTTTGTTGARAYNGVIRNFAFSASGAGGPCTGEGTACTSTSGRAGVCHADRCCTGCWDGTRCHGGTSGATCGVMGGACISCSDAMPCTLDVCTAGACSNPAAPAGNPCEDGMFCTIGETCNAAGTCGGGTPNSCADTSACTTDSCDEAGDRCMNVPGSGCFIGGTCTMSFTVNPANPCQVCDPARNTNDWSPRAVGIPCGTGSCSGAIGSAMLVGAGTCDATATCVAPAPTPCPSGRCAAGFPSTACDPACTPTSCPAGSVCSTSTMRCVTPAAVGERCAAGNECTTGFCADGVCCMSACSELCDSCDLTGSVGTCLPSPVGESCGLPICVGGSLTAPGACDAAGMCMRMGASACPSGLCLDATTCNVNCTSSSCPVGQVCTAAMRCVTPAADGVTCTAGDECISGNCVDGVCCDSACTDTCVSCNQAGRGGLCTPYTASTDPELECPIGSVCSGGRACAPGMIDAGPPDAGPVAPDAGSDAGAALDATVGFDAGEAPAPRRGCSCRAAGLPEGSGGALVAMLGGLALTLARRRRPR